MGTKVINPDEIIWDDESRVKAEEFSSFIPTAKGKIIPLPGKQDEKTEEPSIVAPAPMREYKFPTLRPRRTTTKMDTYQLKNLSKIVDKLEDPNDASKAREVLNSGARLSDIDKTIKIFGHKDRTSKWNREKQNIKDKTDMQATVDQAKAKQKYAASSGEFQSALDNLDYIVDEFDDDFVGMGDTFFHDMGRAFDISSPKMSQYKKRFATLLPNFKELENMGASFTASEQKMLKDIMPEIKRGDSLYRADLVNFIEILRNKISGKLNALEDGDYRTGTLREIIGRYDNTIKRAKNKFGTDFTENNKLDENGNVVFSENKEGTKTKPLSSTWVDPGVILSETESSEPTVYGVGDMDALNKRLGL